MATTLQKEYALIYYIRHKLGQAANNGFLHELYTEKNIREILEALVKNNVKDQSTINVEKIVNRVMPRISIDTLTDPRKENAKFNLLPNNPVSLMQLYMGKTIDNMMLDAKQRIFIDDITEAKDGLGAWFVSTFTRKYMLGGTFTTLVTLDKKLSRSEIEEALHKKFPNSNMFSGIDDMSELDNVLGEFATRMVRSHFTNKDINAVFLYIKEHYNGHLTELSLENAINEVVEIKETEVGSASFDDERDLHEADVKEKVQSTASIGEYFKDASKRHFVGTLKYTRNGKSDDGETPRNEIQITLRKQELTDDGSVDNYTQFVNVINRLLAIESLPPVRTGTYKNLGTIILSEEQYHALFPEYFVTVGIIKEKVSTASEMGGATMKSGDETTNIVDNYTGEEKYDNDDEEDSYFSDVLALDKTRKLTLAKMLATLNGHPQSVPDQIQPTKMPNSAIYELNRILVREIFNSPYENLQGLVEYLTTNKLPEDLEAHEEQLAKLKNTYLASATSESQESAELNIQIKAFATILSELSQRAQMDPSSKYSQRVSRSGPRNDITIKIGENTYILNNLPTIVSIMVAYAKEGKFINSLTLDSDPLKSAINFLTESGLLTGENNVYTLDTDTESVRSKIDSLNWVQLPTIHNQMMSDALRNCSYIYKHNGWEPMSVEELKANKFTPIKDTTKVKTQSDYTSKFVNLIERLQTKIKPYIYKLKHINDIIDFIRKEYNIPTLTNVEPPKVTDQSLSAAEGMMSLIGTDNSADAVDNLAQGFYLNSVTTQYENVAKKACNEIKQKLAGEKLLNTNMQKALISKFRYNGGKVAVINDIFGDVKKSVSGNIAENPRKMETRHIFTVAQDIILLYNKVRGELGTSNPSIATIFPEKREYVKIDDVKEMANGKTPSDKMYNEDGSGCPNDFLLNAYLIDILFEAIYMLAVHFNLQSQSTYTAQEVMDMDNISEMERYIKANINVKVEDNLRYSQLLSSIRERLGMLFSTPMHVPVVAAIANNPDVTQLSIGSYNKMNGRMAHSTSDKVMSTIEEKQKNSVTKKQRENNKKRFFQMF